MSNFNWVLVAAAVVTVLFPPLFFIAIPVLFIVGVVYLLYSIIKD